MTIERRYSGGFKVVKLDRYGNVIEDVDTVFFTSYTKDEATRSLIDHDGYDADITVIPPQNGIIPLTAKELEELCDGNEVIVRLFGSWGWGWAGNEQMSGSYKTKEDAMRGAVWVLGLDTNGDEDDAE